MGIRLRTSDGRLGDGADLAYPQSQGYDGVEGRVGGRTDGPFQAGLKPSFERLSVVVCMPCMRPIPACKPCSVRIVSSNQGRYSSTAPTVGAARSPRLPYGFTFHAVSAVQRIKLEGKVIWSPL
ncbi:unnamed protein product [Calypogeia fissa]